MTTISITVDDYQLAGLAKICEVINANKAPEAPDETPQSYLQANACRLLDDWALRNIGPRPNPISDNAEKVKQALIAFAQDGELVTTLGALVESNPEGLANALRGVLSNLNNTQP